jgi:hypothetical protein
MISLHSIIAQPRQKHDFRRRGHSMPPRSRKLKKSVKFFSRHQKKIKLILFYKKINFFIKIKIFFYFFNLEIKNFLLQIIFISMN